MRNGQTGRRLWRFLFAGVLAFAILLAGDAALQKVRLGRAERAIDRFRAAPNGEHAHQLIQWLADKAVTREQGERILTLLLRPEIVTRPAYPAGQSAKISVSRPLPIEMPQGRIELEQQVWADGRDITIGTSHTLTKTLSGSPKILIGWPLTQELGTHHAEIRITGKIMHPKRSATLRGRLWGRPVLPSPAALEPTYECHFTVPFDVNIVEQAQAERLELVADAQLDEAMRAAISMDASRSEGFYSNAVRQRRWHSATWITFKRLPVAVGFELSLRMSDGREFPQIAGAVQHMRIRSDDSGKDCADVGFFGIEEPGEYTGTLVLRPDPDYAYEDPAIKSIWNGTLEFPISFSVYVGTQIR